MVTWVKTIFITDNIVFTQVTTRLHQLGNPSELPLEIIEVQSGGYLGEDDIIRYEDRYGRADENLTD